MQNFGIFLKIGFFLALLAGTVPEISCLAENTSDQAPLAGRTDLESMQPEALEAAQAFYHKGNFDGVIRLLAGHAIVDPYDFDINLLFAKALLAKSGQLKTRLDDYHRELTMDAYAIGQRLHRKSPTRSEPYYIVAKSLLINERLAKAKHTIEKAIYLASPGHPDYAAYLELLGDCQAKEAGSDVQMRKLAAGSYNAALAIGSNEPGFSERVYRKQKAIKPFEAIGNSSKELDSRSKLAILPWHIDVASDVKGADDYFESIVIEALSDAIIKTALFAPLYSYYQLDKDLRAKPIDAGVLRKDSLEGLWMRKSFFSALEPNIDLIIDLGRRLKVDAVLVLSIQINRGPDFLKAFLVEINNGKVFRSVGECNDIKNFEGYDAIYKMTEKVFNAFYG